MRRLRLTILVPAVVLAAFALPAAAVAASGLALSKHRITFTGQMTTTWTQLPHQAFSGDPYCWTASEAGQGKQTVTFRTTGSPTLSVTSVSGGPFFQILPLSRRAAQDRVAPGFGLARINRTGSLVTTYGLASSPGPCDPPPAPYNADQSGCGASTATWDVQFQVRGGILFLSVEAHPEGLRNCPFFEPNLVGQRASGASFPERTATRVGNISRLLARPRAKIIVKGSRTWQSRGGDQGTLTARTTVTWTLTVRRIR